MLQKIKEIISKLMDPNIETPDQANPVAIPKNFQISFVLEFKKLKIGELKYFDEKWQFSYSDEFKNSKNINHIIDFPLIEKIYESKELWPFFKIRIPNLEIPSNKSIIIDKKLNKANPAELLIQFGEKSASNPFKLVLN